jgi:hypothetical protein
METSARVLGIFQQKRGRDLPQEGRQSGQLLL